MRKGGLFALAIAVVLGVSACLPRDTLDVYFIDVGAGDAILIDYGDWEALLDAGNGKSTARTTLISVLAKYVEDDTIELAILSHPHADHYGGFEAVFAKYTVLELWRSIDPDADTHGPTYNSFLKAVIAEGLDPELLECGDTFTDCAGSWTILGPSELVTKSENDNENSLVLLLTHGEVSFLFTGDIEDDGEKPLLEIDLPNGQTILKVSHHGSDTSSSLDFLDWANPDLAVISTKYSDPPALKNITLSDIPYVMTSASGTIRVSIDRKCWTATAATGNVLTTK